MSSSSPILNSASHLASSRVVSHSTNAMGQLFGPEANPLLRIGRRRWILQAGLTGAAGLSLPLLLQAKAQGGLAENKKRATSVIQIWLSGGPSQIDMWDMKPEMSPEIRGPFKPISTCVPGIDICEHMPLQAAMMDKFAIIRSMDAGASNHTPITFQAANPKAQRSEIGRQGGGYPSMGSVAAKFKGPNRPGMPPFVALANSMVADVYGAGDLGQQYEPLDGMRVDGKFSMPKGVEAPRLQDRDSLRRELDRFRRNLDSSVSFQQQDRYTQEAYDLVLGGAAQKAFNLAEESDEVRNRYGRDSFGDKALLARRLVESGVTFVTMSDAWGHWDHHGDEVQWGGIAKGLTPMLPVLDRGITALIGDLDQRGLLETTLVIVIGEFGRSPVMTKTAGRDHWPGVMSFLMAGGGTKGGQVIGATDRRGGSIHERPLGPGDLAATVFSHLGIDPGGHWVNPAGRPTPLVEVGKPISELV
ncbi:MAG: DUF1501 domain-containing protein [Planctomycetales bacterium]|jgi:hypothetical protein|nr:DUF1501 domain-containing protein [Planctomycetales bacterium]